MTADEAGLLAAVCGSPDDDVPRMVYADWLDEHGRPERAEFVRLQVRRAEPGGGKVAARLRRLYAGPHHVGHWLFAGLPFAPYRVKPGADGNGPAGPFVAVFGNVRVAEVGVTDPVWLFWQRGFVSDVGFRMSRVAAILHAPGVVAEHPVRRVRIGGTLVATIDRWMPSGQWCADLRDALSGHPVGPVARSRPHPLVCQSRGELSGRFGGWLRDQLQER